MKLTFWGAARTVTGSMHEVAFNGSRFLLDCGQYQGRRQEARERNSNFPFPASSVDAVILSHAHIDHSGNLPVLVKRGFNGPIYASSATADLCVPMLADSAHLQEMDAMFLNKRRGRRRLLGDIEDGGDIQPIYTTEDAQRTYPLFRPVAANEPREIAPGLRKSHQGCNAGFVKRGFEFQRLRFTSGDAVKPVFDHDLCPTYHSIASASPSLLPSSRVREERNGCRNGCRS